MLEIFMKRLQDLKEGLEFLFCEKTFQAIE